VVTDVYRTSALICPECASPMREFHKRLVCDGCQGMLLELDDFRSACADLVGDVKLELFDREPSKAERKPICPRCGGELGVCRVKVNGKKLKGRFSVCDRDGLWFARSILPDTFARITRTMIGYIGGTHSAASVGTDAAAGLTIAGWRNRPRHRAKTLSPVNAHADQTLPCPACRTRELVFMGDRYGCDGCHGLFVENAALVAMVEDMTTATWELPPPTGAPGARSCPICAQPLADERLEGEPIDRCPAHGVWFDPNELGGVLHHAGAPPTGLIGWLRRLF